MLFEKKASFISKNYCLGNEGQLNIENYPAYLFDIHKKSEIFWLKGISQPCSTAYNFWK